MSGQVLIPLVAKRAGAGLVSFAEQGMPDNQPLIAPQRPAQRPGDDIIGIDAQVPHKRKGEQQEMPDSPACGLGRLERPIAPGSFAWGGESKKAVFPLGKIMGRTQVAACRAARSQKDYKHESK